MTDKNKSFMAKSIRCLNNGALVYDEALGLTAQEYAAIHLKVADSGTPWLDQMIEKSRRQDLQALAMQALIQDTNEDEYVKQAALTYADLMLAAGKVGK